MSDEEFIIPVDDLFPKFKSHLDDENNHRILFSGKFGIGKTYFLNKFFENKKEEYEVFHLFPVNYQISSNEDIIELLKYDILVELIKNTEDIFQANDYTNFIDLQRLLYLWGKDNFMEVFKTGISFIPKLGKPLKDTIALTEDFWKFKNEREAGEKGFVEKFLENIKKKDISETDTLSELLKQKIAKVKKEKQSVLILDDLERIDPEHIFRILNVFSAHLDLKSCSVPNKFGFDKVIVVADFANLKSIFHHKYGENTDASGYFDKFFSKEVFEFQNEEVIIKFVDQIILRFKIEDENLTESMDIKNSGFLALILKDILISSIRLTGKEKLNLRQLLKATNTQLDAFRKGFYIRNTSRDNAVPQFINLSIKALISIFGGISEDFLTVVKEVRKQFQSDEKNKIIHNFFSTCLLSKISPFEKIQGDLSYGWSNYSIKIKNGGIEQVNIKENSGKQEVDPGYLFLDLLIEYIEKKYYEEKIEIY